MQMTERRRPSYRIDLHVAGELATIEQTCREYCWCNRICVAVQAQRFVYPGGQEDGARIGLIDYPRFPSESKDLWSHAYELASRLLDRACQNSILLEGPEETVWLSRREQS